MKGLLGLAVRAGQAYAGQEACGILVRAGKCGVLLLDGGTAENTRKKYEDLCRRTETPLRMLPSGMIEKATGRMNMAMALKKGSFAEQFTGSAGGAVPEQPD